MKKRLSLALAAGALMAAMLPGVASAEPGHQVCLPTQAKALDATGDGPRGNSRAAVLFRSENQATFVDCSFTPGKSLAGRVE